MSTYNAFRQALLARPVLDPTDLHDHAEAIDHADRHTKGINDYVAAEVVERGNEMGNRQDTEPHGMYWHRAHPNASPVLRAHAWFYKQVADTADQALAHCSQEYGRDSAIREQITEMAEALRSYVQSRNAVNQMAGARKLRNELDDAMYQLCQSAKYYIDATERMQYKLSRGEPIDDNQQLNRLKTMAEEAAREGYIIAQAVIMASDIPVKFDFAESSRRVVNWSCKKLTDWFATKRQNEQNSTKLSAEAAALEISSFLKRK